MCLLRVHSDNITFHCLHTVGIHIAYHTVILLTAVTNTTYELDNANIEQQCVIWGSGTSTAEYQ
jgi:hypothetical protein